MRVDLEIAEWKIRPWEGTRSFTSGAIRVLGRATPIANGSSCGGNEILRASPMTEFG